MTGQPVRAFPEAVADLAGVAPPRYMIMVCRAT